MYVGVLKRRQFRAMIVLMPNTVRDDMEEEFFPFPMCHGLARGEPVGERPGRFRQPGQQIAGPRTVFICGYSLLLPIRKIAWCFESRKLRLSFKGSRICFGSFCPAAALSFLVGQWVRAKRYALRPSALL